MVDRLAQQLEFLRTIDALKGVERASPIIDQTRRENSVEHSWHLAMYALVLAEHAPPDVDISRVVQMLLLHDIVEIDARDMPLHGDHSLEARRAGKFDKPQWRCAAHIHRSPLRLTSAERSTPLMHHKV